MQWYDRYKLSTGEPLNWNRFGRNLLGTIGAVGSAMALVLYFGMSQNQAMVAIQQQPQMVETALSRIPPAVIEQAKQMAAQSTPATVPVQQPSVFNLINENDVRSQIEQHEGKRYVVYPDSVNVPTIGIGFNLDRSDARQKMLQIGADYDSIRAGEQALTEDQINKLFDMSLSEAFQIAKQYIPDLGSHPPAVQKVIVDMAFNLGPGRLQGFAKLKSAIQHKDYARAAQEMVNSRWYGQVKNRGTFLVNLMKSAVPRQ